MISTDSTNQLNENHKTEQKTDVNSNNENKENDEFTKRLPCGQWGSRSAEMYEKVTQVGEGTFGKVYKAKIKSNSISKNLAIGDYVALKQILMDNEKEGFPITAIREIMILKRLQHQNIINLIEIVTSKPSDKNKNRGNVYLVFEYMEHDLQGLGDIKINFNLSHIKCILHQVLTGINYIHSNNIIHRDIKGANILINNKGEVKIADFGLARQHNPNPNVNKQYTNRVVTLWYRSPELLLGSTNYGTSVDIWSVGCLFSELLTGVAPFRANKEQEQIEKIFEKCGSPSEESWPGVTKLKLFNSLAPKLQYPCTLRTYYSENKKVTDLAFDLLSKMLELDPSKRITAEDALKHDFFKEEPMKCEPKELPKIEKDSHEYQSRQQKKQILQNKQHQGNAPEMMVAKQSYNNPNYFNKNNLEVKPKPEESKAGPQTSIQANVSINTTNKIEALLTNSKDANTLLGTKRQNEPNLDSSDEAVKKAKFSPNQ